MQRGNLPNSTICYEIAAVALLFRNDRLPPDIASETKKSSVIASEARQSPKQCDLSWDCRSHVVPSQWPFTSCHSEWNEEIIGHCERSAAISQTMRSVVRLPQSRCSFTPGVLPCIVFNNAQGAHDLLLLSWSPWVLLQIIWRRNLEVTEVWQSYAEHHFSWDCFTTKEQGSQRQGIIPLKEYFLSLEPYVLIIESITKYTDQWYNRLFLITPSHSG